MQPTRLTQPMEAVAANVSDLADASNAAWADMADAKESNDGKFDFCQNDGFVVFSIISIVCVLSISLTKYCKTFAEVKECFGIMRYNNQLECSKIDLSMLYFLQIW
jgi:hypothetical protein